jgi:hypothetical protein
VRSRPDAQLAWEAPMACGYGACYGCVVEIDGELKRLCVEGPVPVLLNASGCLDALTAPDVATAARRLRDEDRHAAAARGQRAAADRRDRRGMLNAIGLANPAATLPRRDAARAARARRSAVGLRRRVRGARVRGDVRALADVTIELNLSCPNVDEAPESAAEIVAACREATAAALREALTAHLGHRRDGARRRGSRRRRHQLVNTLRGLALDATLAAALARGGGGYSGPALKPVALAASTLREARRRCRSSAWAASGPGATRSS